MPRWAASTFLLVLLGCAGRTSSDLASAAPSPLGDDAAAARAAALAFLDLEARGDLAADTLLASGADFIMTGVRVVARPRVAGVNGAGTVASEEVSTGVAGAVAWVVLGYRFESRTAALNERARATIVLEKQRAGWKIRHVHTSMVERWER